MEYFANSFEHILAELERIDLLIAAQVARARKLFDNDEQFRGLYISEEEVDALLNKPIGRPRWAQEARRLDQLTSKLEQIGRQISRRKAESLSRGIDLRLHRLQHLFRLDQFQMDVMLICLASELDLRYERLYAYLQDDVTKKRPSVDLALGLLAPSVEDKLRARVHFDANAPLISNHLIELVADPSQPYPPLLAKYLKANDRIAGFLLGSDELDDRIQSFAEMREPQEYLDGLLVADDVKQRLIHFLQSNTLDNGVIVYLRGPYGVGRQKTAEAVCREQGVRLLIADLEWLSCSENGSCEQISGLVQREAKLQQAAVYWKGFDTVLDEQKKSILRSFIRQLEERPALTFLAGETIWQPADSLRDAPYAQVELVRPTSAERFQMWSAAFNSNYDVNTEVDISALATKFKFTGGQILDAAATAKNLARQREAQKLQITLHDLYEACRMHSNQKLSMLARKIIPKYKWHDIVLPDDRLEQLRETCNYVKYRARVYDEWGFDHKLSLGKGLSILFAGPSGTGKTMAAEIIAGELGLELYKIDLSTVVSKYIGETEKNLSGIFAEAETANAILFFDEADALFGKRSEVRDSHDRYANIETGYLLQRMEEYEGVVILATNLRKNMDEAFVRRLHFTVEFPFPGETDRHKIWLSIWPAETPRDPSLDLNFMARRFEISGGNICNIALAAAFLAADDGGRVDTTHLMRATKREYQKMGKVLIQEDFEDSPHDTPQELVRKH